MSKESLFLGRTASASGLALAALAVAAAAAAAMGPGVSASAQFDDQFDPFDDSFYEPGGGGPPYLGDVVKNVPRVGRRNDFFLKAAKSVPRIGRRSDHAQAQATDDYFIAKISKEPRVDRRNDFFLKAAKSVPRIGRRNDFFLKAAKSVPRIGRRDADADANADFAPYKRNDANEGMERGQSAAWPWFRNPDLIPRAFKRSEPKGTGLGKYHGLSVPEVDQTKEIEEPRLQAEV